MRERPILFQAPKVRAILDGRKTMTRRMVKPQPTVDADGFVRWASPRYDNGDGVHYLHTNRDAAERLMLTACPHGVPGDRLWRENSANVVHSKNRKRGGFKGVSWNKNASKWEAGIAAGELRADGKRKRIYLGLFTDPVAAARAYDAAALKYFGEFAAPNFGRLAP